MSFALPEYDAAFGNFLFEAVNTLAMARSELLSGIEVREATSTANTRIRTRKGMALDFQAEKQGFEIVTEVEAVRQADFGALLTELDKAAEQLEKGFSEQMFGRLDEVTAATGNTIDAGGKPISFDLIYQMLEKIEMDVDDDGELILPSLVMHPDMVKKLQELGDPTPEQDRRMEELKQRKRDEALARRRSRRLS